MMVAPEDAAQQRELISDMEWDNYIQADPDVPFGPPSTVSTSIFTVPKFMKDTKNEAYVPRRVSLGPYHHGSAELPPMRRHKGIALHNDMDFANRASDGILLLEKEIRYTYDESIDCNGQSLARMLCLDGCFLLEVLRSLGLNGLAGEVAWEWYSPLNGEDKILVAVSDTVKDILMLENQVPFIVLLKLLQLEPNSAVVHVEEMFLCLLVKTTCGLFKHFDDRIFDISKWLEWLDWSVPARQNLAAVQRLHHLLGFLHRVIVSPPIFYRRRPLDGGECSIYIKRCSSPWFTKRQDRFKETRTRSDVQRIRRAVELRNVGIKFKPCYGGIQDIVFHKRSATIFLPPIRITDITEVLFRNLIAFEMCQPWEINYVSYYVNLMDNLIDSEEDVALLIRMGVLENWVGRDKEVVDLFKGLRKAAPVTPLNRFDNLAKGVNEHLENKSNLRIAELVRDYFSSPWKASASVAAIVLLLLTLAQTIFTAMQTFK